MRITFKEGTVSKECIIASIPDGEYNKGSPPLKMTVLTSGWAESHFDRDFIVQGKKRYFEATDPHQFLTLLKQKEALFQDMLPALIEKKNKSREHQEVTVYSGQKGVKTVFEFILEELKNGGEYLDFGVSGLFREKVGSYWDYWQKQKKRDIFILNVFLMNLSKKEIRNFLKIITEKRDSIALHFEA